MEPTKPTIPPAPDSASVQASLKDLRDEAAALRKVKRGTEAGIYTDAAGMLEDVAKHWTYNVGNHVVPTMHPGIRAILTKHGLGDLICDIKPKNFKGGR